MYVEPSGDLAMSTLDGTPTMKGSTVYRPEWGDYRLTANVSGQSGQLEYTDLPLGDRWTAEGNFWSGGGLGADAFYIYVGAHATPGWEDDNQGHYSINFDEYQDEIQLNYGGVRLATFPQGYLDTSQWHSFKVVYHMGRFTIWLNGKVRLAYFDPHYASRALGNLCGFGARTGLWANEHYVANMAWSTHTYAVQMKCISGEFSEIYLPVGALAYSPVQLSYLGPALGTNGKVNVARSGSVHLELASDGPFNPDAQLGAYVWEMVAGELTPAELDALTLADFNVETSGPEIYYSGSDLANPGEYTVYCEAYENINGQKVESEALAIPVRVWTRPTVHDAPPSSAVDDGLVSWYGDRYIGVVDEPVYLMADGEKGSTEPGELIEKYLWDLDDDWDTVELEQDPGEAISHIWDQPNLSGKIRCKAVTNYGVESAEMQFDLKVYQALQVDAGGPYTGRPTKPIELVGSIDQISYPGAVCQYQWRVDSAASGDTLLGDAAQMAEYVELTPNEQSKIGVMEHTDVPGDRWSVTGEFWSGGGTGDTDGGGDVFYIYLWAEGTPVPWTDEDKAHYSINYNEWDEEIQLKYQGVMLDSVSQPGIDNSQWRRFSVLFDQGHFRIYLDHRLRLEYTDAAYLTRMSNERFGLGARTGGATNYHRVRNVAWASGDLVATDDQGEAEHIWTTEGEHLAQVEALLVTTEGLVLLDMTEAIVSVEAGKPTAMPGGPYRGGIAGGNFSPVPFEGNHPDFLEEAEVGYIEEWVWVFEDGDTADVWNPTHAFATVGQYVVSLTVKSEFDKWSTPQETQVEVIDGTIAGYVHAADLRTPVREVKLRLTSSHVDKAVLAQIASSDSSLNTAADGALWTLTDDRGYYAFEHLPLGSYRIRAGKGTGDEAHEFETSIRATELTLDGPNQLAMDFVDISVFPVGGRIVYSLQKNGVDVIVDDVEVTAQSAGGTNLIEALPSTRSLSATGVNYSMPLFAGKYLFLAKRSGHDIRIEEGTPGYDLNTQLVTIKDARTDIDFVDHTTYELIVHVRDSGEYPVGGKTVVVSGDNGQAEGVSDDAQGRFSVALNPGVYTVYVQGADPEEKEVDMTGDDGALAMTIPVKIELSFSPRPKLFDLPDEYLSEFGLRPEDNPEGYMYSYPPDPVTHTYTVTATAAGHPVEDFTVFVTDEVSMMTDDPPSEQEMHVHGTEGTYLMRAGLPRATTDDPPLAAPKKIAFRAQKEGYLDSDKEQDEIVVLGEVLEGSAAKIVSVPTMNYLVLHDPPGDGSYSYFDDAMTLKGIVTDMRIKFEDTEDEIPVYPSPWTSEREIEGYDWGGTDARDRGLIGYQDAKPTAGYFVAGVAIEAVSGALAMFPGKWGYLLKLAKLGVAISKVSTGGQAIPGVHFVQYEISPNRYLETPSGATLPDLLGPGKGDIYYGEGWTLGLQTKHLLGIMQVISGPDTTWQLTTRQIETYDILDRTNQYLYTVRDIENIVEDLGSTLDTGYLFSMGMQFRSHLSDSTYVTPALQQEFVDNGYPLSDSSGAFIQTISNWVWVIHDISNGRTYTVMNVGDVTLKVCEDSGMSPEERSKLLSGMGTWGSLLNNNLAYVWHRDYASQGRSFEAFLQERGGSLGDGETLIFSAGPAFEYSRDISAVDVSKYTINTVFSSDASLTGVTSASTGFKAWGVGLTIEYGIGSALTLSSQHGLGSEFEAGQSVAQKVGFLLQDDDVGDNFSCRVYEDPRWGTPIFFQEPGSYSSDPWETGTNRAVDVRLELVEETLEATRFDYHEGAHYRLNVTYTGARDLESTFQTVDFALYAPQTDNAQTMTVRFNGTPEPYIMGLNKDAPIATVALSLYPPEIDQGNSGDKTYALNIVAQEIADLQITRVLPLTVEFSDLRAPRALVTAPYEGERISPVFFPEEDPFDIEVVSEDMDVASIQLQIRAKQPNGVWEPWRNLSGMLWETDGANENVAVFRRLDVRPQRHEFTFGWSEDEIATLGVGEYGIRAVATDSATTPNRDLDPPPVVFLVDEAKPSVLNSLPDYQARESERIYRGELSVTFTDDMRAGDFDDRTFYVTDLLENNAKVAGYVSYSPALRKVVFVPVVPFQPNGFYRVQVKTDEDTDGDGVIDERGVHDLAGNPLDNAFMWTFRTTDAPFEPTWSIALGATDGASTDGNNIASVEYGAMDEEDEEDARAVPALASQMRLSFLNREQVEFDRDTRPADGRLSHHWFFVVDNAALGSTVDVTWQPSLKLTKTTRQYQIIRLVEFDGDGTVTNTIALDPTLATVDDETGEIIPMVAYTYTNGGERSRYFRLDVQKVGFVADMFAMGTSGWRFFSVPIIPQRAEPFVNLGDDIDPFRLYQYSTALGGYKIYPFDIGEVGLQSGYGYFTRLGEDAEVDVGGASNQDDVTRVLETVGWHAIGNPFVLSVEVDSLQVDGQLFGDAVAAGWVEGTLYRWDVVTEDAVFMSEVVVSDGYVPVASGDSLNPWDGYWLRTRVADLELTIPAPAGLAEAEWPLPDRLQPPIARPVADPIVADVEGAFDLRVELIAAFSSDVTTTLGTRPDAEMGQDPLDRSEPPTLAQTVAVYFDHADWGEGSGWYNTDYRPILHVGEERTWCLTAFTDRPGAEMTLSWEHAIEQIPDDIMLYLRSPDQSAIRTPHSAIDWLDMREVRSIDLVSDARIAEIGFEVRAERHRISWPSDVEVTAEEQQVLIRWMAEENPFVVGHVVERMREGTETTARFELSSFDREFEDRDVEEDVTYIYRLLTLFGSGAHWESEPIRVTVLPVVKETALLQSYPNPGNPEVWIPYALADESSVVIEIYNTAGQRVRVLDLGVRSRGRYVGGDRAAYWDGCAESGERVTSGIYLYTLRAGGFAATRKMIVLK